MSVNSGFWDLDAEDRAAVMQAACERAGFPEASFWDLEPEDRAAAYDRADGNDARGWDAWT